MRSWPSDWLLTRYWKTLASSGNSRTILNCPRAELSWCRSGEKRTVCPTANLRVMCNSSYHPFGGTQLLLLSPVRRHAAVDPLGQPLVFLGDLVQMLLDRECRGFARQFPNSGRMPPVIVGRQWRCGWRVLSLRADQ